MSEWPVTEGRYKVGNPSSPVAVCTTASVNLELPMEKIAIAGKCVTENLGIEKIVKNIISNPNIRYLIICGRPSMGHFVDDTLEKLVERGVDEDKRIIGAKGSIPVLKNLSDEEIERFRKQIRIINISGNINKDEIMEKVEECCQRNPGPFEGGEITMEKVKEIIAEKHIISDWTHDPKGFFTIYPVHEKNEIAVEHHEVGGKLIQRIIGKSAEDLYHKIIKMGIISRLEHAAYLGRELAKAEIALKNKINYEQDSNLTPEPLINTDGKMLQPTPKHGKLISSKRINTNEVILTYIVNDMEFPTRGLANRDEEEFREFLKARGLCRVF